MQQSETSLFDDKEFNRIIFACVDRGLSKLGEATKMALYELVNEKYGLPPAQFSERPLEVASAIRETLGDRGFSVVQKFIVGEIHNTFSLVEPDPDLEKAVYQAKTVLKHP